MKKIGIVGWKTGENSFGITVPYAEFFAQYGQVVVLGPSKEILPELDLLVLPGGKDASSHLYGEVPSFHNSEPDLLKEFFLLQTLPKYIAARIPIFGICLGMQQIAIHFGCKMDQHIAHKHSDPRDRGELVHKLRFPNPAIEEFLRNGEFSDKKKKITPVSVNSLHHQAVDFRSLRENANLDLVAFADEGQGSIPFPEIIRHIELPIWGVQYHPEEIYDWPSHNIISLLLNYERAAH